MDDHVGWVGGVYGGVCVCLPLLDPAIPTTSYGTHWSQVGRQHVFKCREGVETGWRIVCQYCLFYYCANLDKLKT